MRLKGSFGAELEYSSVELFLLARSRRLELLWPLVSIGKMRLRSLPMPWLASEEKPRAERPMELLCSFDRPEKATPELLLTVKE